MQEYDVFRGFGPRVYGTARHFVADCYATMSLLTGVGTAVGIAVARRDERISSVALDSLLSGTCAGLCWPLIWAFMAMAYPLRIYQFRRIAA